MDNVSAEEFRAHSKKRFATIDELEIIGKTCTNMSPAIKENPA
jgi:uncharacterized protein with HEPN domain